MPDISTSSTSTSLTSLSCHAGFIAPLPSPRPSSLAPQRSCLCREGLRKPWAPSLTWSTAPVGGNLRFFTPTQVPSTGLHVQAINCLKATAKPSFRQLQTRLPGKRVRKAAEGYWAQTLHLSSRFLLIRHLKESRSPALLHPLWKMNAWCQPSLHFHAFPSVCEGDSSRTMVTLCGAACPGGAKWGGQNSAVVQPPFFSPAARLCKPCPPLSPCSGCKNLLFKDYNKHHVEGLCFIKLEI